MSRLQILVPGRARSALIVTVALLAGAGWAAAVVATLVTGRALPAHFPRGTEACFGRVYGAAFLKAHPEHRVSELYVYRDFSPGLWNADARPRALQIAADRASNDDLSVVIAAKFRDKSAVYDRGVSCSLDPTGASCSSDCEGASFDIYPEGRGLVLDRSSSLGFVHLNGSGGGSGTSVWLRLKTDGIDYRLDPMPIAACRAIYDHAVPAD